jgi:general secretion pathway protein I
VKDQRGFTLLEVVIATAIMSIGIVSALELFSGSLKLAGDAEKQSKAMVLARSLVDEDLWVDVLEQGTRNGNDGPFTWSVETHPIDRELVGADENPEEFHDVGGGLGLWLIAAEVHWQSPLGDKSVSLETARLGNLPQQ